MMLKQDLQNSEVFCVSGDISIRKHSTHDPETKIVENLGMIAGGTGERHLGTSKGEF